MTILHSKTSLIGRNQNTILQEVKASSDQVVPTINIDSLQKSETHNNYATSKLEAIFSNPESQDRSTKKIMDKYLNKYNMAWKILANT